MRNDISDNLTDLAAGEIHGLAANRRRREIARDPALAREWAQTLLLRDDLRRYARENPSALPTAAPPALRFGGVPVRRGAFFTGYAILTLLILGIVAVRRNYLTPSRTAAVSPEERDVFMGEQSPEGTQRYWELRGRFRGGVLLRNERGRFLYKDPFPGSDPDAPLTVALRQKLVPNWPHDIAIADMPPDFTRTFTGGGWQEIRDEQGALIGTLEMTPWTEREQIQVDAENADRNAAEDDFHLSPERLASCGLRRSAGELEQEVGVAAGRSVRAGVSWKIYGYAKIRAIYRYRVGKPIVQEGGSRRLTEPNPEIEKRLALRPVPQDETPILCWAVAGKRTPGNGQTSFDAPGGIAQLFPAQGGYLVDNRGRWPSVTASGRVSGYGRHEIKNADGEIILTLDVKPL